MKSFLPIFLLVVVSLPAHAAKEQLKNLDEEKPKPRFVITDKVWPAQPGEAAICLWKDDQLAALSVTVDDNPGPDLEWWIEKAEKHNIPVTWFLITERISGSNAFNRKWEDWASVLPKGHGLESHTVMHLHVEKPEWQGIEWEYAESIKQIEEHIPDHKVHFLAVPGGKNRNLNDRAIAAKYYNAVRGGAGKPNPANATDYLAINGMTAPKLDSEEAPWADLNTLFVPGNNYRGWAVIVHHFIKNKEPQEPFFAFFDAHRDKLWMGLFGDVARYGQQRDTATLTVTENAPNKISFEVTDRMDDSVFNYPLTVKVRLPSGWKGAAATQDGKPVESKIVEHDGASFALVDAVPDNGAVTLAPL